MTSDQPLEGLASSGVEALIDKLRQQGVDEGRRDAARIIEEARTRAEEIQQEAEARGREIVDAAMREADQLTVGGREALRVAMRDTILRVRADLTDVVSDSVRRLITTEMEKDEFLRQLIRDVACQARERAGVDSGAAVQVLVPRKLIGADELRQHPLELHEGGMTHFALNVAGEALREGVSIGVTDDNITGIRLYLEGQDVQIDLTDKAVADLLLAHLQPRFRAVVEGTIK